jgi:hypothetical protein
MGHVEPGGAAEDAAPARLKSFQFRKRTRRPDPLDGNPVWDLWRDLMALYPLWRSALAAFSPRSQFRRENTYWWFDVVRGLRSMPSSQAVVARLATVSDAELEAVISVAEINARRQEHFVRVLFLSYITIPFTVGAIWAELAPGQMVELLRDPRWASWWAGGGAGLIVALVVRFLADWRARSFLTLLELARTEREAAAGAKAPRARRRGTSPRPIPSA